MNVHLITINIQLIIINCKIIIINLLNIATNNQIVIVNNQIVIVNNQIVITSIQINLIIKTYINISIIIIICQIIHILYKYLYYGSLVSWHCLHIRIRTENRLSFSCLLFCALYYYIVQNPLYIKLRNCFHNVTH